jgi:hypothetical protein
MTYCKTYHAFSLTFCKRCSFAHSCTNKQGKPDLGPEILAKRQTQELQHGRLAMLAIAELLRHDAQNSVVPGFDGLDNLITGLPFLYN